MAASASGARIVTVTANPAVDVTTAVERIEPERKLRCHDSRVDPGGGGVNVSRVVHRLGGDTIAIIALGGAAGEAYRRMLEGESVPMAIVPIGGDTRQNFAVTEAATGSQFRFVLEGPQLSEAEWRHLLDVVRATVRAGDWLVVSGSLPPGVPDGGVADLVALGHAAGASVAVDSSGPPLLAALAAQPDLVKPSRHELSELTGRELTDLDDIRAAAEQIATSHGIGIVAVTLADEGALLVTRDATISAPATAIAVTSTIGAGDSFLAGLLLRLAQGHPAPDALRTALAAGAATAETFGTRLCSPDEVARLEQLTLAG